MTRTEAAHTNGALSHGPVTAAGKAASSRNALKHGLTAVEVVIPGEDPLAFDLLRENIRIDESAETARELDLVFEMAAARWRLRRLVIMEKAVVERENQNLRRTLADPENQRTETEVWAEAWITVAESPAMKQIHRYETRLRRALEKAQAELRAVVDYRHSIEASGEAVHPCRPGGPVEQTLLAEEAANLSPVQNEPEPASQASGVAAKLQSPVLAVPNEPERAQSGGASTTRPPVARAA